LLDEARKISLSQIPDQGMFDIPVFVHQHVALRHDPTPGNLGMRLLKGGANPVCRLSDNLDRTLDRKMQHQIF
jgi:hypothetical protein